MRKKQENDNQVIDKRSTFSVRWLMNAETGSPIANRKLAKQQGLNVVANARLTTRKLNLKQIQEKTNKEDSGSHQPIPTI